MLGIRNLSFSYLMGKKKYSVLKDVNFTINDDEFFCIIGPSGCGKSTLLKIVAGFETPDEGEILDNGKKINGVSHERAMVFQEDAVFPWLNVPNNREYRLKVRGIAPEIKENTVQHYINLVGLNGSEKSLPKKLSGGMKKRVEYKKFLPYFDF